MAYCAFLCLTSWPMVALSFPDRYLVHAREPLITQAPRVDVNSLFARGDVSTCGFVSGDVKSPLTCPTSYSCTSTVQDMIGWACCDQIQCAGNYRICADYGAQLCAGGLDASDCSSIYTSILSCSSAAPSCFSYARSLSLGAVSTYFSLACGQTSGTVLALQTFLGGNSPAAGTAASSTAPGQSSPFSTASNVGSSPTESSPSSLSAGEKAGIIVTSVGVAVTMVGVAVAIMVGWWKPHQVLWLVTCGRRGCKRSVKPQQAHAGHQLGNVGSGGAHNVGANHVAHGGRWAPIGRP